MITFILAVCGNVDYVYSFPQSPPSRAAWIEISRRTARDTRHGRRRLHGRRGLKYDISAGSVTATGRRLHGRRGLKCPQIDNLDIPNPSPPSRAAWIEMQPALRHAFSHWRRRLHGRRGLKSVSSWQVCDAQSSPPSRAAWTEISPPVICFTVSSVAAFTGGVD